jgi:hypothetical protein
MRCHRLVYTTSVIDSKRDLHVSLADQTVNNRPSTGLHRASGSPAFSAMRLFKEAMMSAGSAGVGDLQAPWSFPQRRLVAETCLRIHRDCRILRPGRALLAWDIVTISKAKKALLGRVQLPEDISNIDARVIGTVVCHLLDVPFNEDHSDDPRRQHVSLQGLLLPVHRLDVFRRRGWHRLHMSPELCLED